MPDSLVADSLLHNYYIKGGRWLWATADTTHLLHDADTLAAFLAAKAASIGLPPEVLRIDSIRHDIAFFRSLRTGAADSVNVEGAVAADDDFHPVIATDADLQSAAAAAMARVELGLSRAFLRCAVGLRYGFVEPQRALNSLDPRGGGAFRRTYDIELERPSVEFLNDIFAHADSPMEYLNSLEPQDTIYQRLRERLATDTTAVGRKRAICNMERRRWRHTHKVADGQRHLFVNIPSQQLWAIAPDSVFSMKICCGAWATKTPLLESHVRLIQLNPEWRIPHTIMTAEVSHHAGDSAWFARRDYFIIRNATGDTVSAKRVTADQLRQGGYRVTQHSGPRNSLGRMIFRFPNKFDVYLHDTNSRGTFNAERRTVSHGCVRVERPFDLAMFLLPDADEWLLDRMRMTIDMAPQSDQGKEYLEQRKEEGKEGPVRFMSTQAVSPQVPVAIDYYTLWPNPQTGVWETWRDRYEYDDQIMKCLKRY